jgi:outer membrane protein assembly factor BamB
LRFLLKKAVKAGADPSSFPALTLRSKTKATVLAADRKLNSSMLFTSSWREAPAVATDRQFCIGAIFSSALVVNGGVYFGSTDGNLYAVE